MREIFMRNELVYTILVPDKLAGQMSVHKGSSCEHLHTLNLRKATDYERHRIKQSGRLKDHLHNDFLALLIESMILFVFIVNLFGALRHTTQTTSQHSVNKR